MAREVVYVGGSIADAATARRARRRRRREMATPRMTQLERQVTRRHFPERISATQPSDRDAVWLLMGDIRRLTGRVLHISLIRAAIRAVLLVIAAALGHLEVTTAESIPVSDPTLPASALRVLTAPAHAPTAADVIAGAQAA